MTDLQERLDAMKGGTSLLDVSAVDVELERAARLDDPEDPIWNSLM